MHYFNRLFNSLLGVLVIVLFLTACGEESDDMDPNDDQTEDETVELSDLTAGEGSYLLTGDYEFNGSGSAIHDYRFAETGDQTWSVHRVIIEDADQQINVMLDFYILDPEADAFDGKKPESGTYQILNVGLNEPSENYVVVTVEGDGLDAYFDTEEESSLDLTVSADDTWEAEFQNVLENLDFDSDEVMTVTGAFKATPAE